MQNEDNNGMSSIEQLKQTLNHIQSNAHIEAYEHPKSKDLYLFITEEGREEIKDIREELKVTVDVHIMSELLSGCNTGCFIGNGFSIEGSGDDGCAYMLCYDADYSECPSELDGGGVKYGRVWEYLDFYTGDMINDMEENGYVIMQYTYDESWNTHDAREENENEVCPRQN